MRRLIYMLLACTLLAACSDDNDPFDRPEGGDGVTLTLRLPGFTDAGSRAVDEDGISDLQVLFFDASGTYISESAVDRSLLTGSHPVYQVSLSVPAGAARVELVANYGKKVGGNPSEAVIDALPQSNIVMWGAITVDALKGASPSVDLLRASAKTTVECTAPDFTVDEILHCGASSSGFVAPESEGTVNIPADASADDERALAEGDPYYFYETAAEKCYILLHGSYNGVEGWYKIAYIPAEGEDGGKEIPLLRNHHYKFTVTGVNDAGWPTREEAVAARPDNRITVELKDHDEKIYNMIACRDYELGVSQDRYVEASADGVDIDILTSYSDRSYSVEFDATLSPWVKSHERTSAEAVTADATRSEAMHYVEHFTLEPNSLSEEDREAVVTVRSGDLSRQVRIIQRGADLKRGAGRRALIYNLDGNPSGQDYYDFVDNSLQGAKEENMTVDRNNCLHFRVYNNQYYYTIPYKEGDAVELQSGSGKFTVTHVGDNWEVRCPGHVDYELWDGAFSIVNGNDNTRLSYEVCHRGLFHRLTGGYQIEGPKAEGKDSPIRTGWFYYEQVNTIGEDGKTYYLLDRNMGADSNRPYSVSSTLYDANAGASGGYFRIADTKGDNTLIERIAPEGFEVPAAYHLQQLDVNLSNNPDAIPNVRVSEGALAYVTFPIAGYMEGTIHKDEAHTCLWSRSLLSGNQGFSEASEEYGWWFRYLDMYGERKTVGNTRITTRGGEPRAMTVRCLHGPAVPDGWDIPDPGTNRKRVVIRNVPGEIYCWFTGCPGSYSSWPKMYVFGTKSYYYDVPTSVTSIQVSVKIEGQPDQPSYTLSLMDSVDWTYYGVGDFRKTDQ